MSKAKHLTFETAFSTYYRISQISAGGAGVVVKVKDENKNIFAIKYLSPQNLSRDKIRRFKNELSFCSVNKHENVIKVIDWGWINIDGNKCPFYVMPHYEATFRKLLKAGISIDKALPYFSQILNGVEAAHLQNVWHRDLKP